MSEADEPTAPSPASVVTSVLWESVTGRRLEELLYGLLEAMGPVDLVWRAGAEDGVSASDGGRDFEAVFVQPGIDGSQERTTYWVEAKGRRGTVPKAAVTEAIRNLDAHPEVDVFVFATNSRFSNPTRDWVTSWQAAHPRPKVRLWDRDDLSRMVRANPTVVARVLPDALNDDDRLKLLWERFWGLGEAPSFVDLQYFWSRPKAILASEEPMNAIAMFTYAEDDEGLVHRPWSTLIPQSRRAKLEAVLYAVAVLPRMALSERARPVDLSNLVRVSSYLLIAVLQDFDPKMLRDLLLRPNLLMDGGEELHNVRGFEKIWIKTMTLPVWSRVLAELRAVCASDCVRVMVLGDDSVLPTPIDNKRYWSRFGINSPKMGNEYAVLEQFDKPCAVGLKLDAKMKCPLASKPKITAKQIRQIQEVVEFRKVNPDGQFLKLYRASDS